ncbi:uncharacterized protein [Palaemon carinicauda]|uniref:uncharacterized protein n=1 Tax=Palaemon carinicauda TaxID=392227 RepID=UPI0035B62B36
MKEAAGVLAFFLLSLAGSAQGQCNGRPLLLTPGNSTGNLAFPEVNWDPITGIWQGYQFYPTAVKCTWILRAPPSHVLFAAFLYFDTEEDYDFVTIYTNEERSHQLLKMSGDLTRNVFLTSPSDTMVIDLISDQFTTYTGFLLAYRYEPRACVGGETISENFIIALPPMNLQGVMPGPRLEKMPKQGKTIIEKGGRVRIEKGGSLTKIADTPKSVKWEAANQYPPWLNCTWRVAVDSKNLVEIDILEFKTAKEDVLTIWQMNGARAQPLLQYGGEDPPRTSFQSTKPLIITFHSQADVKSTGFLMEISYIQRACDPSQQELTSPTGVIAYPRHNLDQGFWRTQRVAFYGPDSCQWVISAPEGYAVNITFLHFDTREVDPLEILEDSSVVLQHSGGLPSKRNFVSQGPRVTLRFEPQQDTTNTGFLIQYSWVLKDCSRNLENKSGEIRSPFYPDTYRSNVTCRWTISPPSGHFVHILIARLRLDAGDALQISDGVQDLKVTGSPHSSGRLFHLTPTPSAKIFFSSDQLHNKGYFLLKYTSFRGGSCDFSLSPCGWKSVDPLQSWSFRGAEGLMAVAEESGSRMQFPRGYRSLLTSPWITTNTDGAPVTGPVAMCLRLDYLLHGPDAFLLTVSLRYEGKGGTPEEELKLLSLYGPHGNKSLTAAINFTATDKFKIWIQYERGYGPHYNVGVKGIEVKEGQCGQVLDALTAVSCAFKGDYCGWRNTHNDHRNWLLTDEGIMAEVRSGSVSPPTGSRRSATWHEQQWADLISPVIMKNQLTFDLIDAENSSDPCVSGGLTCYEDKGTNIIDGDPEEGACIKLHFHILSEHTELQVLLKKALEGRDADLKIMKGTYGKDPEDVVLWTQGRVRSPDVLEALIDVHPSLLPDKYRIILRALGAPEGPGGTIGEGGAKLHRIELHPGRCNSGPSCNFNTGFCSWSVSYSGKTVWYIKPHEDEKESGSHAAVSMGGSPDDTTSLTSDIISTPEERALTFRYRVVGTSGCLSVSQRVIGAGDGGDYGSATTTVIWHQCRGKGLEWLRECVALPLKTQPYQELGDYVQIPSWRFLMSFLSRFKGFEKVLEIFGVGEVQIPMPEDGC